MKRITYNGKEYSVTFGYQTRCLRGKRKKLVNVEQTTCTISESLPGSNGTGKIKEYTSSSLQFIKDPPNRNIARQITLAKIFEDKKNSDLDPNLRNVILEKLKLRTSGFVAE